MRMLLLWLACLGAASPALRAAQARRYDIVPPAEAALEQASQGDWEGARAALREALALDGGDAEAWSALGLVQEQLRDRDGARRSRRRLAALLDAPQRRAVEERQRRYLADLAQERQEALGADGEPGFALSPKAPQDPLPSHRATKWDHHGWPSPTPRPTATATPAPLRLPGLPRPAAQDPRIHAPIR